MRNGRFRRESPEQMRARIEYNVAQSEARRRMERVTANATDHSHLHALELGLSHERERLANAKSPREREMRTVWVAGYEREIAGERRFLGLTDAPDAPMTDDELLAELMA